MRTGRPPQTPADPIRGSVAVAAALGITLEVAAAASGGRMAGTAAGRVAAGRALATVGAPSLAVGRATDGRPIWPPGHVGSISHRGGMAVAAVARATSTSAVGVDLEVAAALTADDAELVLARPERAQVRRAARPAEPATMLWSAKEAAFKAWSGALGGLPGVDPVDIVVDLGTPVRVHAEGDLAERVAAVGPLQGAVLADGWWVLSLLRAGGPLPSHPELSTMPFSGRTAGWSTHPSWLSW